MKESKEGSKEEINEWMDQKNEILKKIKIEMMDS
jgi:hypothetical protein